MAEAEKGGAPGQPEVPAPESAASEPIILAQFTDLRDQTEEHERGADVPFSVAQVAYTAVRDYCMVGRPPVSDEKLRIAYLTGGLSNVADAKGFNYSNKAPERLGELIVRAQKFV